MINELEKKVISLIQKDIPISKRPYKEFAESLGISEDEFINILKSLNDKKMIRRFGATLRHQKSGFKANAMVAWKVEESKIQEVGEKMASFKEVSHCYRRNPSADWQYNLYTMIHAKDKKSCYNIAKKLSKASSVDNYELLFSQKELKKTSMQYFN
jgi:siroheme decarboxylase